MTQGQTHPSPASAAVAAGVRGVTQRLKTVPRPVARCWQAMPTPSGPVVLVVDDDPDVRDLLISVLEEHGITVVAAAAGGEALRILGADPSIDLLLTDVMMPGITGITLAERAAALRPDLKIIFASAYPGAGPPPGPLLHKPFRIADLLDMLQSMQLAT
jgi:CheY-like chemotaxis protein